MLPRLDTGGGRRVLGAALAAALLALAAACGGEGGDAVETAPPPEPTADLFVAPTGSDAAEGTADAPLASLQEAHLRARPGDVVELAGGRYPVQEWSAPRDAQADPVVFRPAAGARVRLAYLRLRDVDDVEIRGVETHGWYVDEGSERVVLRDVRSRGSGSFITAASDVRVLGGEIGPVDSSDGLQIKASADGVDPRGIVVEGLDIHDITRRADPSGHVDCLQVGGGRGVVIRSSRFRACATQGVFLRPFGGGTISDVLVENNWFGSVLEGFSGLIVDEEVGEGAGVVVRYNSSLTGLRVEPAGSRVVANVAPMQSFACRPGVVYRHNVWSEASCDPSDRAGDLGFADPSGFDLRVAEGSAAVDAGDPDAFPPTDIDGRARPAGEAPDAGAAEVG